MYIFLQIFVDLAPHALHTNFKFIPITPVKLCLQDLVEHSTFSFQKKKEKFILAVKNPKRFFLFLEEKIATLIL